MIGEVQKFRDCLLMMLRYFLTIHDTYLSDARRFPNHDSGKPKHGLLRQPSPEDPEFHLMADFRSVSVRRIFVATATAPSRKSFLTNASTARSRSVMSLTTPTMNFLPLCL